MTSATDKGAHTNLDKFSFMFELDLLVFIMPNVP